MPKAGDRSIQTYGNAPTNADFASVAGTVRSFELSVASRNTRAACELLASPVKKSLIGLYARSRGAKPGAAQPGCPKAFAAFLGPPNAAFSRRLRAVRVTDARLKADTGFVIYRMPGIPRASIPIRREGGAWKVAALGGSSLP